MGSQAPKSGYGVASNREQADTRFSASASKMVRRAEGFKGGGGITIGKLSMYVLDEGQQVGKGNRQPGQWTGAALLHSRDKPSLKKITPAALLAETATTGMMARDQPLLQPKILHGGLGQIPRARVRSCRTAMRVGRCWIASLVDNIFFWLSRTVSTIRKSLCKERGR